MTNTETVSTERLREILAGLEGVSPGPWDTTAGLVRSIDGDVAIPIFESWEPWKKHRRTSTVMRQDWHNRHHIARCDPDTMRSILTELIASRTQSPAEWEVEAETALIERIGEICFKRHERGFICWPLMDVDRIKVELRQALRAASISAPERSKEETGVRVADGDRSIALASWSAFYNLACEFGRDINAYADAVNEVLDHDATIRAALEPASIHKGEAFGTAWQTSYTGDEWHFAREASFAPSDLERGIVKNVTPVYAAPAPVPVTITDQAMDRIIEVINEELIEADVDYPAGRGAGHRIEFDEASMASAIRAALSQKPGEQG